jgi:superoxide dismutase
MSAIFMHDIAHMLHHAAVETSTCTKVQRQLGNGTKTSPGNEAPVYNSLSFVHGQVNRHKLFKPHMKPMQCAKWPRSAYHQRRNESDF